MDRKRLSLSAALNAGHHAALETDPKVLVLGEDIGQLGGVFRVTTGLLEAFGKDRVIDTPLAESGIVGTAIGLSLRGFRPVCEIQFDGFIYPAFNQIVSQVAKLSYRTGGALGVPLVIRVPHGGGIGSVEHHSDSPEAYFSHTAGLRVVACSTPNDAYWMLQQAITSQDPVIFLEPKRLYWHKDWVDPEPPRQTLHQARVVREGSHVTLASYAGGVATCREAAEVGSRQGCSVEVVDLRSLAPLDLTTLERSVSKTGRLVVVHDAPVAFGVGAEVAAQIHRRLFYQLEAPVARVGGYGTPYPPSRVEHHYLPGVRRVLAAIDDVLQY